MEEKRKNRLEEAKENILCAQKKQKEQYDKKHAKPLNFVSVQKQSGGCDCGLFTLAFATTLVSGHNPGHYVFDQRKMRKHLYKCLDKGHMEMFPHKEVQSHSKIASIDYNIIDVYCVCRMPEINGVDMVECCKCAEWYHLSCVDVPKQILEDSCLDWFCPSCL